MDVMSASPVRVIYVDPGWSEGAPALAETSDDLSVEYVEAVSDDADLVADADCVVAAHRQGLVDGFDALEAVQSIDEPPPVILVSDADVAERALARGAADVVRGDPTDPPVALLAHRIQTVVDSSENAEGFTEGVLDTLSDVVYVLDRDGSFREWNEQLPALTSHEERALPELSLSDLVVPGDRTAIASAIDRARSEGVTQTQEASVITAVGDRVSYEFNLSPLTDDNGTVFGLAGTAHEVTDSKLREQRLSVLTRVLRHNVRNQMTVVQGRAERLEARLGDDDDVAAIDDAAAELVELSDKARRVGAALRESSANRRALDVVAIIETTIAALRREFPDVDMELMVPERVEARTTEGVTFAVEELVRNAVVHNDSEQPTVRIHIERQRGENAGADEDVPDTVAITVADDGPGIPDSEEVALVAGQETDLNHATGLGLWLVNWVTTAAGGELTCEESAMGGTAVTLEFPAVSE